MTVEEETCADEELVGLTVEDELRVDDEVGLAEEELGRTLDEVGLIVEEETMLDETVVLQTAAGAVVAGAYAFRTCFMIW